MSQWVCNPPTMATVYDRQEINDATINPITRLEGNFQWTRPKDDLELKIMVRDYTLHWMDGGKPFCTTGYGGGSFKELCN